MKLSNVKWLVLLEKYFKTSIVLLYSCLANHSLPVTAVFVVYLLETTETIYYDVMLRNLWSGFGFWHFRI